MLTVTKTLDFYYFEHIAKKAVARRRAEYAIEALKRHIGDKDIYDIDIPACREYGENREEEGVTKSTTRRELGVLQAAAHHNVKWRRLGRDELPSIELPPEGQSRKRWLFKDELNHFLEVASETDHRVFRFVQLAYHTASRKRAVETLSWNRVDLNARRIDLQNPDEPRTKKRRPIVPVSENMTKELQGMLQAAHTGFVLETTGDIRRAFDRVAEVAKLTLLKKRGLREAGTLTPHLLRHSRATHLLEEGKSPWVVASLLGDSVSTVIRVYGHACPEYLAETLA